MQSKINHTHHGGLGFHVDSTSTSSSDDWKQQPSAAKFVPAKTEPVASLDDVKGDQDEKVAETSSDKHEEKKKKKSKS